MLALGPIHDEADARSSLLLQHLRCDSTLADAVITAGDEEFKVHRAVITPFSAFFKAALCGAFAEAKERRLELKDASAKAVNVVIDYIYGGEVTMNLRADSELALETWELAHRFQMDHLRALAARAVIDKLSPDAAIRVLEHAKLFGSHEDVGAVLNYISRHLQKVAACRGQIEMLDVHHLDMVLRSEDLIAHEHDKFDVIMRWIAAEKEARLCHVEPLLLHVEFHRFDRAEVSDALVHPDLPREVLANKLTTILQNGMGSPLTGFMKALRETERTEKSEVIWGEHAEFMMSVQRSHITKGNCSDVVAEDNAVMYFNFKHWAMSVHMGHQDGKGLFMYFRFDHRIRENGVDSTTTLRNDCSKYSFRLLARAFTEGFSNNDRVWNEDPSHPVERCLKYEFLFPLELPMYFKAMDAKEKFRPINIFFRIRCSQHTL